MKGERLILNQAESRVEIISYYDEKKQLILNLWLVLWTLCGMAIMVQFFLPSQEDLTTYLLVWAAFWAYFEYKVVYAFRWRKWGKEVIFFRERELVLIAEINGRGLPKYFDCGRIRKLQLNQEPSNSFVRVMNQAYWNPGQEKLTFDYGGKQVFFGKELNEQDAKRVLTFLQSQLKQREDL